MALVVCGESLRTGPRGVKTLRETPSESIVEVVVSARPGIQGDYGDERIERCWLQPIPATEVLASAEMTRAG